MGLQGANPVYFGLQHSIPHLDHEGKTINISSPSSSLTYTGTIFCLATFKDLFGSFKGEGGGTFKHLHLIICCDLREKNKINLSGSNCTIVYIATSFTQFT